MMRGILHNMPIHVGVVCEGVAIRSNQGCIQDFLLEVGNLTDDLLCTCVYNNAAMCILVNNHFLEVQ